MSYFCHLGAVHQSGRAFGAEIEERLESWIGTGDRSREDAGD
jgi:hypothetical protein